MAKQKKAQIEAPAFVWPVGIAEAATYCGMSIAALKYHIYTSKQLAGRMIGHSIAFERATLDQFLAHKRQPGRPAMQPDTQTA